jgi:perosamine synthetase
VEEKLLKIINIYNMKIIDKFSFYYKNDIKIINKIIKNKKLSGTSEIVFEYEKKLALFFQSKFAVATSSGTSAIQTALYALNVRSGDEVIISSVCPLMSVISILELGAKPIFCDTYDDNFGLNISDLKKIISLKTRAVIEVPMWGYPTSVPTLKKYLKNYQIPLILDLAQAHGTKLNKKYLSYYSDISCFSTHDRKILSTGEGGFCLTNNKSLYKKMQSYIKFGNMDGVNFGLNFKLGSMQAGIGFNRINFISDQIKKRTKNAKYILNKINNNNIKELEIIKKGEPNYYTLLLLVKNNKCQDFINYLDSNGIPSDIKRYNFKVLYKYPLFKKYIRKCRNSESLSENITTIPVHPGLTKKQLDYIIKIINKFNSNDKKE